MVSYKNEQGSIMPRLKIFLALTALLLSSLACATVMGGFQPREEPDPAIEEPPLAEPQTPTPEAVTCPALTDQIMEISTSASESEGEETPEESTLVSYTVDGNEIFDPLFEEVDSDLLDEQTDQEAQARIWEYYTQIIPAENRETLVEYVVFTDGMDNTLASVSQSSDDPSLWSLQVDIADTSDYYSLTFTLIHEYGHLLTLGPDQVPPSLAVFNNPDDDDVYLDELSACENYFPGEGCANADSYINAFYDHFWNEIQEEWNEINLEEDDDIYYEKLDDFYYKYEDQFVTDYAPTSPAEDIAEAWAFFVLGRAPQGDTIAEQKILFFYDYPELVEARSVILNNVCHSFPQ
jgi:hypothetical protein